MRTARYNNYEASINLPATGVTHALCFLATNHSAGVATFGDSGSLLLDVEFHPFAMLFAGIVDLDSIGRVIFATPLDVIDSHYASNKPR
jgi:hypothetical protein